MELKEKIIKAMQDNTDVAHRLLKSGNSEFYVTGINSAATEICRLVEERWIPVSDIPKSSENLIDVIVLAYGIESGERKYFTEFSYYSPETKFFHYVSNNEVIEYHITHFMYKPNPPKQ